MKTVAVIGSNAFSGQDFVDLLLSETDYRVVGISRSEEKPDLLLAYRSNPNLARFTFKRIDLNRPEELQAFLSELKPAHVVNFAAQSEVAPSWEHPEHWFATNGTAIAALGNFLRRQKWLERYLHISSPEVYGTCEGTVREDAPLNPSTPYAASKAAGDLMLSTLVKQFQFPCVSIRATNVYGARQQLFKIIPRTAIYLKLGRTIELHGGGQAVKSYIHIRDVSRGELAALEDGRTGELYHLSPDGGVSVREVVERMCRKAGKDFAKATKTVAERPGQDKAYVIDSSKARGEFGWAPKVGLDEGLGEVVEWVERHWETVKSMPLDYRHKA